MIYRQTNYTDTKRTIMALEPFSEQGDTLYLTPVHVPVVRRDDGQTLFADGNVPIQATSIEEAFEKFDESVEASVRAMRADALEQMTRPKLVIPGGRNGTAK